MVNLLAQIGPGASLSALPAGFGGGRVQGR
jgi:hypothetical protein